MADGQTPSTQEVQATTGNAAATRDMALAGLFDALAELVREGVKFLGLAIEAERASRGG